MASAAVAADPCAAAAALSPVFLALWHDALVFICLLAFTPSCSGDNVSLTVNAFTDCVGEGVKAHNQVDMRPCNSHSVAVVCHQVCVGLTRRTET